MIQSNIFGSFFLESGSVLSMHQRLYDLLSLLLFNRKAEAKMIM
jgi:hypothetical protein